MPEKGNCQTLNMDRSTKPKHRIRGKCLLAVRVFCLFFVDFVCLDLMTIIVVVADPLIPFLLLV